MAITGETLRDLFHRIAEVMAEARDELCRLDGVIGDADHGIAMETGFGAVREAVAGLDVGAEPTLVLNTAAKSFLNAVGASSGPLYATALMRAGAAVKGKPVLDGSDVILIVQAMAGGIADRGKAVPGDKTMLDAWAPAAAAAGAASGNLGARMAAATAAAQAGAESTKDMVASKGRSARLGERARGHADPGAVSAALVIGAMNEVFAQALPE